MKTVVVVVVMRALKMGVDGKIVEASRLLEKVGRGKWKVGGRRRENGGGVVEKGVEAERSGWQCGALPSDGQRRGEWEGGGENCQV